MTIVGSALPCCAADASDFRFEPEHLADVSAFVRARPDGMAALDLVIRNMHCPSCVRIIERGMAALDGVEFARLNATSGRLGLVWNPKETDAETLLQGLLGLGYDAVPFDPDAIAAEDETATMLTRCLAVAGFAAMNVMLLSVAVWAGLAQDMGGATRDLFHWLSALIALPAVAYAGRPFFFSAMAALRSGRLNMDVPIALAVLLAAGMSLFETTRGGEQVYFDAGVGLLFFLLIGRVLDRSLRGRVRSAAENLSALAAVAATRIGKDGTKTTVRADHLVVGDTVLIAAGDRVPADARVICGKGEVEESLLTGEPIPRPVEVGAPILAGTTCFTGPLIAEVTATDEGTVLAEIAALVQSAEQGRARYVRLADRVARWYAPAVHLLSALAFLGWMVLGAGWQTSLLIAVTVLIVTCPCALGLAVPAVQVGAVSRLLKDGVLARSADGLERLATIDTVVFDKTGTLTVGEPTPIPDSEIPDHAWDLAAALASASRHPLSRAIARVRPGIPPASGVGEVAGAGLEALVDGRRVRLGSRSFVEPVAPLDDHDGPELWLRDGEAAPVRFRFEDRVREDAAALISWLRDQGIEIHLFSGDRSLAVARVADDVGIADWCAGMNPTDKIKALEALSRSGRQVCMVGDGLNDAPALAAAAASLSPASGADIARTAADFVLQGDRLGGVASAITVSRKARRLVLQNFGLAIGYNLIAVPLAVSGFASPLVAAVAMSASSIVVTANALRVAFAGASLSQVGRAKVDVKAGRKRRSGPIALKQGEVSA